MANPQKENGFTVIANEILDNIVQYKLNGAQYALILSIIRKTYGFNKKSYSISLSFLSESTGLNKNHVKLQLDKLIEAKVINVYSKSSYTSSREIGINKNYDEWDIENRNGSTKKIVLPQNYSTVLEIEYSGVSKNEYSGVLKNEYQKRNKKEKKKEINIGEKKMAPTPKAPKVGDLNFNDLIDSYTTDYTLKETILQFIAHRKEMKKPFKTQYALKLLLNELNKHKDKIAVLNQSIMNGWQGIFELKQTSNYQAPKPTYKQILPDMDNYDPFA